MDISQYKRNVVYGWLALVLFLSNTLAVAPVNATNISVWPHEIMFNHEPGNHVKDALTIKNTTGEIITSPEWKYNNGNPLSENFAYIMGQNNPVVIVRFNSNCSDMHLVINLTVISGTGIGTLCNHFVSNYTALEWITIELNGSVPSWVVGNDFTWQWEIYAIPNNTAFCAATSTFSTSHRYFTVLSEPKAPMGQPWASVLEYATNWAHGCNTEQCVIASMTNSLYNSGFIYKGSVANYSASPVWMNLTKLVNDISSNTLIEMNCIEFSNFLHILTNSLGINGGYLTFGDYFTTRNVLAAGASSPATITWIDHQIGLFNSMVADPSVKIDADGSQYFWLVAGDKTFAEYADMLTTDSLRIINVGVCQINE